MKKKNIIHTFAAFCIIHLLASCNKYPNEPELDNIDTINTDIADSISTDTAIIESADSKLKSGIWKSLNSSKGFIVEIRILPDSSITDIKGKLMCGIGVAVPFSKKDTLGIDDEQWEAKIDRMDGLQPKQNCWGSMHFQFSIIDINLLQMKYTYVGQTWEPNNRGTGGRVGLDKQTDTVKMRFSL